MAEFSLTPVDYDPFQAVVPDGIKLTPVDHDPFAQQKPSSLWREFPAAVGRGIIGKAPEMLGQAFEFMGQEPQGNEPQGSILHEIGRSLVNVGKMYG